MTIDIDKLTEPELVDLNRRIVERLRLLQQMRAHKQMLAFKIGDRVAFGADGRGTIEGMLTRYNRKSVTVITDDGQPMERLAGSAVQGRRAVRGEAPGPPEPGPPEVALLISGAVIRRLLSPGRPGRVPGAGARSGPVRSGRRMPLILHGSVQLWQPPLTCGNGGLSQVSGGGWNLSTRQIAQELISMGRMCRP